MSAGLWHRMREGLIAAGQPLTVRQLAERIEAVDEIQEVRRTLYQLRKTNQHVERVDPLQPGGAYRWRLQRDARVVSLRSTGGHTHAPLPR